MSEPFSSLYVVPELWDLTPDASGNIALAGAPYSQVQDVASACRTFYGEVYYDTSIGVPYLGKGAPTNEAGALLGKTPALNILQGALAAAALTVPGVVTAQCVVSSFTNRTAGGQVQFTTDDGQQLEVSI